MTLALHLRDPHESGSWGFCPLRALTGWDCPFCGGLRAVNDLTDLRVGDALQSNLFFVVSVPLLLALWVLWLVRSARGSEDPLVPARVARPLVVAYAALLLVFTVVRNTPWGHSLWA